MKSFLHPVLLPFVLLVFPVSACGGATADPVETLVPASGTGGTAGSGGGAMGGPPPTIGPIAEVALGTCHSCVRSEQGEVWCWGWNVSAQTGQASTHSDAEYTTRPAPVSGLSGATQIAAGDTHSCARRGDGSVVCWGSNGVGELGRGAPGTCATADEGLCPGDPVPAPVVGLANVREIVVGTQTTCALREGDAVLCWGDVSWFTKGKTMTSAVPLVIPGFVGSLRRLAMGLHHACALAEGGVVQCMGYNDSGQTGTDSYGLVAPATVTNLPPATRLALGVNSSCAIDETQTVHCWGQHADLWGGTESAYVPPGGAAPVAQLALGELHQCALLVDGRVACRGRNDFGQLGIDSSLETPQAILGLGEARQVAVGRGFSCAVTTGGQLACWGDNHLGQLGDGTTTERHDPVIVLP